MTLCQILGGAEGGVHFIFCHQCAIYDPALNMRFIFPYFVFCIFLPLRSYCWAPNSSRQESWVMRAEQLSEGEIHGRVKSETRELMALFGWL